MVTKAAKSKSTSTSNLFKEKPKVNRPGVHAKTRTSKLKQSRNYKKLSRGQG
jgi:hypothetical protein